MFVCFATKAAQERTSRVVRLGHFRVTNPELPLAHCAWRRSRALRLAFELATGSLGIGNDEEPGGRPRDRRLHDRPTLAPRVTRSSSSCSNVSGIPPSIPAMARSRASFEG